MNTYDIRLFDRRVNFIGHDTERILALSKSSVLLHEYDHSIQLLESYMGELNTLDRAVDKIVSERRKRRTPTELEENATKEFIQKYTALNAHIKEVIAIVEKRKKVLKSIAQTMAP